MYSYPANLTKDNGTLLVRFRDVPEAITFGETREDALRHAKDALETALDMYVDGGKPLPRASVARRGEVDVPVGAQAAMKLALYDAYRVAGVTKSELARRMGIPKTNVDRLFSLTHASRVDMIESAAAALGKRLVVSMRNVAALLLFALSASSQIAEAFTRPCAGSDSNVSERSIDPVDTLRAKQNRVTTPPA
jgi:antitoxin HicB